MDEGVLFRDFSSKTNKELSYIPGTGTSIKLSRNIIGNKGYIQDAKLLLKDIFLPQGYPQSVSDDYLEYQIWDTCQAFCSSISGTLTMRAIMQGVGVGSETATPVSAAVTWIMKDGTGMVGSILFAWSKGSKLDTDCKKWRLFADILNDAAMIVELSIPSAMHYAMYFLCLATAMKAIVGVAGGATRAALTAHQAIQGNTADVSAKDGSQEIFVNLCAFIVGLLILKNVTESEHTWGLMLISMVLHLFFNYKAVKCLKMDSFNGDRYRFTLRSYLSTSYVPSLKQVNKNEAVILGRGISSTTLCGYEIFLGTSIEHAIICQKLTADELEFLVTLYQERQYFLVPHSKRKEIYVSFRSEVEDSDILKAYFHAVLLGLACSIIFGSKLPVIQKKRPNSLIFRLNSSLNEYLKPKAAVLASSTLPVEALLASEDVVDKEFTVFSKVAVDQKWNLGKSLLNVNEWRSQWRFMEEKSATVEEKDPTYSSTRRSGRSKVPGKYKTSRPNYANLLIL